MFEAVRVRNRGPKIAHTRLVANMLASSILEDRVEHSTQTRNSTPRILARNKRKRNEDSQSG